METLTGTASDTSDVYSSLPLTDSDKIAKALVDAARTAFDSARSVYWAGRDPGPYALDGEWSLATFEALTSTLESKWRLAYIDRRILLFGDPKDVHEEVTNLVAKEVELGVEWGVHAETPTMFKNL